jgi:leucyl-tRNA synthetase
MRQWVIKITDYAERLLNDIDKLSGWEDSIKEMQRNWIGRSEGAEIDFELKVKSEKLKVTVFTTRPDTLFGCTYIVLAPENNLISNLKSQISNLAEVEAYINEAKKKSDLQRTDLNKDKTGVKLEGIMAINPASGVEVPVFIADYVLATYGTGAVMAVPAHDERDWDFAKKYNLKMKPVVYGIVGGVDANDYNTNFEAVMEKRSQDGAYVYDGININSDFLNGLKTPEAKKKIIAWLEEKGLGKKKVNYKLNDWVFSRQRYWGEPIPMVHCDKCGTVPVAEKDLPVRLPDVEHYEPTGTGESPLANISDWVNTTCPKCGGPAKRETNTMPQWAGSSWYYLRYIDPHNSQALVDKEKEKYWSPVDFYVGGAEHATRHLIYARFWHKFLFDIGVVNYEEPFAKFTHVGLIMAEDGRKMSKRWGNVINPDDIIEKFGADAMRVYEMFMGPFTQSCAWNTNGLTGARKFLDHIWTLSENLKDESSKEVKSLLHKTIKKVSEDIADFKFNTCISAMMILSNAIEEKTHPASQGSAPLLIEGINKDDFAKFIQLLAPFAPHLAEEIWRGKLGNKESIFKSAWPEYDPELLKEDSENLVVQVNGKLRETIVIPAGLSNEEVQKIVDQNEKIKKWTEKFSVLKIIHIKAKSDGGSRLVNIVLK